MSNTNTYVTIGMDLGDKRHRFCVINELGTVLRRGSVRNTAPAILDLVTEESKRGSLRIVMEAGTHSPWISRLAGRLVSEVLVANPRKVRAIWETDRKDDERDAEMLARIGRFDPQLLHPIRHRGQQAQADLALLRGRDTMVKPRTELINSVRGMVKSFGARLPKCSADNFAKRVYDCIPEQLQEALGPMLSQIAHLSAGIRTYDTRIEQISTERYPETALLRQVAGVGPVTALAYVLIIEDPDRFEKSRQVGPFLGLVPARDQSSDQDRELGISKAGDELLRRVLTQAAQFIMGPFGPDCDLRRYGMRIQATGGTKAKRRAVTAVTRKLAVLLHRLWKHNETYEPFHNSSKKSNKGVQHAA